MAIDLEAIRAWKKTQEDASDFGGVCEYDHVGADEHITALIAEVERLHAVNDCSDCWVEKKNYGRDQFCGCHTS